MFLTGSVVCTRSASATGVVVRFGQCKRQTPDRVGRPRGRVDNLGGVLADRQQAPGVVVRHEDPGEPLHGHQTPPMTASG